MGEGGSRNGASLSEEAQSRGPHGRAPLLGTMGYERKALGMGGLSWTTCSGLIYQGLWRRLKEALEVEHLSLSPWELCEGNLEGGLPCWGP